MSGAAAAAPAPADPAAIDPAAFPMGFARSAAYALASLTLGLTQGLGLNLIQANIANVQGSLGATAAQANWLIAAYFATNATATLLLYKVRTEFGLRRFAEIGIALYATVTFAHLFVNDLQSAIIVRAMLGIVAAPLSTLAFYYMLEWLPAAYRLTVGVGFGLMGTQLAAPLARLFAPELLLNGAWHGLYLLEVGLALVAFMIIFTLPLTHPPRVKIFDREDLISFPLIAFGLGAITIVMALGRIYWWIEAQWIGVLAALGVVALTAFVLIELQRKNPIFDFRSFFTYDMVTFTGSLLLFRFLLSEQTFGAVGLFTTLGLQNEALVQLYWVIFLATVAGFVAVAFVNSVERTPTLHLFALALIAIGAFMDAQSTSQTRPENFYLSQALIAFAGAFFLPPALVSGFTRVIAGGPPAILQFLVVFITTQSLGGLAASAILGTFQTVREKFWSSILADKLSLIDPLVAQRVQQLGGAYGRVLTDPAQRNAEGVILLGQQATREANVLAYNDVFLLIFSVAVVAIVFLIGHIWLMRRRAAQPALAAS